MTKLPTLILAGLLSTSVFAQNAIPAETPIATVLEPRSAADLNIDDFLWLNRLIVVFADSDRDPSFREQIELLTGRFAPLLLERDVILVTDTDPDNPSDIRTRLRPRGFGLVLIDKDGRVKLRKPRPWDVRELSRSIDKTELRQQEMRDARQIK